MEIRNYFETVDWPYFSAEFDYFRIGREKWELFLVRLGQLGVNGISLTVPWGFHEVKQGTVDLNGATNPRRDLIELLDLCMALKFQCMLNPGPYGDESLLNQGLPLWLDPESEETALAAAGEGWLAGLSQALVGRQWPEGPIILLQLTDWPGGVSMNVTQQLAKVKWPIWLRKRYHGIEALNEAYGAVYRSVSEVDFPEQWSQEETPLERDAKQFLEEVQGDSQERYLQLLAEAGWRIPIRTQNPGESTGAPPVQVVSLLDPKLSLEAEPGIVLLRRPIQIEPNPADSGIGPVLAGDAPIRADGSVRRSFWQLRAEIWRRRFNGVSLSDNLLNGDFGTGGLVSSAQDTILKLALNKGAKSAVYRLVMNGAVSVEQNLTVTRAKLSGSYVMEDQAGQTDFIFFLAEPAGSLPGLLGPYLQMLLTGQAETLAHAAAMAVELGQIFGSDQEQVAAERPARPAPTSYSLAEARRGLREADAILRKAMASIGGLETGFETILGRREPAVPQPAAATAAISPEVFEGAARESLRQVGEVCKEIAPSLKSAAAALQAVIGVPASLTLEQYQQAYNTAVTTAQSCLEPLLGLIARLRLEIGSETLPLVMWRAHDQLQSLAERLRLGVKRET